MYPLSPPSFSFRCLCCSCILRETATLTTIPCKRKGFERDENSRRRQHVNRRQTSWRRKEEKDSEEKLIRLPGALYALPLVSELHPKPPSQINIGDYFPSAPVSSTPLISSTYTPQTKRDRKVHVSDHRSAPLAPCPPPQPRKMCSWGSAPSLTRPLFLYRWL